MLMREEKNEMMGLLGEIIFMKQRGRERSREKERRKFALPFHFCIGGNVQSIKICELID